MEVVDPIPLSEQQAMIRHQSGSGNMALEDQALAAYHAMWEVDKEQARIEYFKILNTINHVTLYSSSNRR